jgi:hypothetical protein
MWLTLGALTVRRAQASGSGRWGLLAGVLLALAVGTKPSALAAAVGLVAGVAVVGAGQATVRRWVAGAMLAIAALGAVWGVVVWLPNRTGIANVLRIWASEPIIAPLRTVLGRIAGFPARNDGFVVQSLPILIGGVAGWTAGAARWRRLPSEVHLLLGAATGWIAVGMCILLVAPYRPNRYEEPLLPAFAILVAIGVRAVADAWAGRARRQALTAGVLAAVLLVAPGTATYAGWMQNATYRLPGLQAQVLEAIPAGSATQGTYAPALAMRARVLTIVSRPSVGISPGDLYAVRGVRWFVGEDGERPAWASLHPAAWAARQAVLCSDWGSTHVCVYRLP